MNFNLSFDFVLIFVVNVIFLITIDATLENWGKRKDIVMVQII
jgi:hypothetical protein